MLILLFYIGTGTRNILTKIGNILLKNFVE